MASEPSTVFISYSHHDERWKDFLVRHLQVLEADGLLELWDDAGLPDIGDWDPKTEAALERARVVVLLISPHFLASRFSRTGSVSRILERHRSDLEIVPVIVRPCAWNRVRWLKPFQVWPKSGTPLEGKAAKPMHAALAELAEMIAGLLDASEGLSSYASGLQIRRISLKNIRCFEDFDLAPAVDDQPALFTMVLGDNAAGKSTLLRSIALGLSSESDASALIKQLPGTFVRQGADEGTIRLEFYDPENGRELAITTRIQKSDAPDERIRKETEPDPFPWRDVFVCAYGTNRSRQAAASYEAYTLHQAVLSLFDDDTVLQNPEVVLLRQEPGLRSELERRLLRVLMLDEPGYEVTCPRTGVEIHGPWGDHPLRTLSDGYRSTAQWVLDFLGWSIYAGRFANGSDVGGILLVDELEQHLHPRWQRHIVQRLRQQFPKTQIFASTHTPLAAAGTADVDAGRLLRLKAAESEGAVTAVELDPGSLAGLRADQVLASEAFGLYTSRSPGSEGDIARYAELLGKKPRTEAEDAELERLGASLAAALRPGESEVEREVEQAVETALKGRVAAVKPELLDLEVRRQLHELFAGDEAD